jgi:flagellar motor switch protein FliN/FliY
MPFSASPLVPGQTDADPEAWTRTSDLVAAAVAEALPQIPSGTELTPGPPVATAAEATMPANPGVAVTAYLGAGVEGKLVLVVDNEVVEALAASPFGALEPAQALTPALEIIADRVGGRLDGTPTSIAVEDCLDVLTGAGTTVIVPLLAAGVTTALVGVSVVLPAPPMSAAAAATAGAAARSWGIDMLRDVEMEVTCELGRTRMTVRQLLALAPGDVVELDRLAGSPADLLVNGTLLARGEVVVVDESFGLRITEIVTRDAT